MADKQPTQTPARQSRAPATKPTVPEPAQKSQRPRNPQKTRIDAVAAYYLAAGWSVVLAPSGGQCDLITGRVGKPSRMHFIQVIAPNDPRSDIAARNNFIQNAFSNVALPVHAEVDAGMRLTDINVGQRLRLLPGTSAPSQEPQKNNDRK
jgi:hypothetical protein